MKSRTWIGSLLFGLFAGILSILWNYHGVVRVVLAMIAGTCLMVSLRMFAADVRAKRG